VVIGTVQGDHHNIGKNLVAMMLEGAGFRVVDLGIDVKPQAFVQAVREHTPDIVAMSALLTTTMLRMAETVNALKEAGMRDRVKIMAGGAPVTDEFVKKIGGDGYASNAGAAVDKAKELLGW
jgi:5-methyltetrahydrofolate--homocysteine methyltransferase